MAGINVVRPGEAIDSRMAIGGAFSNTGEAWDGEINAVVVYDRNLTAGELDRVESYLALKYGQTLSHDYLRSDGTQIYSVGSFGNAVAGLVNDAGSALDQRIARSVSLVADPALAPVLTVSTDTDFTAANSTHAASLSDGQSLVWGHDGGSAATARAATIGGTAYEVLSRTWKYQDSGDVDPVNLRFDLTGQGLEIGNTVPQLVVSTDAVIGNADDRLIAGTASGDIVTFDAASLDPDTVGYFSVALQQAPTVTLSGQGSIGELGATSRDLTAALSYASNLAVDVTLGLGAAGDTATGPGVGADVAISATALTIAAGSLSADTTVTAIDDTLFESTETLTVEVAGLVNATEGSSDGAGVERETISIVDNDTRFLDLTATTQGAEGNAPGSATDVVFTASLLDAAGAPAVNTSGQNITISFFDVGTGSATSGVDYDAIPPITTQIVIPAGSLSGSYTVTVVEDALFEPTETIDAAISLPNLLNVQVRDGTATASITDDDPLVARLTATTAGDESPAGAPTAIVYTVSLEDTAGNPASNTLGAPIGFDIADLGTGTAGCERLRRGGRRLAHRDCERREQWHVQRGGKRGRCAGAGRDGRARHQQPELGFGDDRHGECARHHRR